jgi:beta-lactamase class A
MAGSFYNKYYGKGQHKFFKFMVFVLFAVSAFYFRAQIYNFYSKYSTVLISYISHEKTKEAEIIHLPGSSSEANVETKVDNENSNANLKILKDTINEYINKLSGTYGVYYYNLDNNDEFGINEDTLFDSTYVRALMINMIINDNIINKRINPETYLVYTKADYTKGLGSLQLKKTGDKFKIKDLMKLSLIENDIIATNILSRSITNDTITNYIKQKGAELTDDIKKQTTPKEISNFLKLLDESSKDNKAYQDLINYMEKNTSKDKIPELLPKDVKIKHLVGNKSKNYMDVGIINGKSDYIICIMSKDSKDDEASTIIANISKSIYVHINTTGENMK